METIKNKVIVWSIDNFNTLGLMRELGEYNLDIFFLIKGKASFAAYSKYCRAFSETDNLNSGLEYLKTNFKNIENCKPIIITAGDDIAIFIDDHREELEDRYTLPITEQRGNQKKYTDKFNMTRLAQKVGIMCPETHLVKWNSEIPPISYPCILKPSHENQGHFNEFKYKICKNERHLKKVLHLVRHDSVFVLQELIQKEADLLIYGCRIPDGTVLIAGTFYKDRFDGVGSGTHGFIEKQIHKSIDINSIEQLLREIGYVGLFSIEFGLYNGKTYFYEINLRNDGTSDYFRQAGANLPALYVYSCAGKDWHIIPHEVKGRTWFIDELFDIENVILRKISFKQWKQDMQNATIHRYYDENDPEPFEIVKRNRFKTIISDLLLKQFRIYIVYVLDKFGLRK